MTSMKLMLCMQKKKMTKRFKPVNANSSISTIFCFILFGIFPFGSFFAKVLNCIACVMHTDICVSHDIARSFRLDLIILLKFLNKNCLFTLINEVKYFLIFVAKLQ
jgi:hypothetical protein